MSGGAEQKGEINDEKLVKLSPSSRGPFFHSESHRESGKHFARSNYEFFIMSYTFSLLVTSPERVQRWPFFIVICMIKRLLNFY